MARAAERGTRAGAVVVVGLAVLGPWGLGSCGGSDGSDEGCNPACGAAEVCVDGLCVATDAWADTGADVADVTDTFEFAPVDGTDIPPTDDSGRPDVRPDVDAGAYNIGASCGGDGDCVGPDAATCITTMAIAGYSVDWPGGYCSSSCDAADPGSCGPGAICINYLGCLRTCELGVPGDCRESEGYTCLDPASVWGMIPAPVCTPVFF